MPRTTTRSRFAARRILPAAFVAAGLLEPGGGGERRPVIEQP